jgi:ligand-binding sensor domain-containing protein
MNCLKKLFILLFSVCTLMGVAQEGVGIGQWRTHMPYQQVIDVEILGSKVYAATNYELFVYDRDDNSLSIMNKINKLSDIGIATIRCNPTLDLLLVAYTNANIDLVDANGQVYNMSDIKDKTTLGNKTINNVVFRDEFAYVACGFGIVVFDLKRQEVKDTYYIGQNGQAVDVTDIAFYDGKIYASTTRGLYYADAEGANLANFTAWSLDRTLIHPTLNYDEMEAFGGKLLLNHDGSVYNSDTLFVYDGNRWSYFDPSFVTEKRELRVCGDKLLLSCYSNVYVYDTDLQRVDVVYECGGVLSPNAVTVDVDGMYWIGDQMRGMIRAKNSWNYEEIRPNGPYSKNVFELSHCGKHVWIATGGHDANWAPIYAKNGVCHFDGNWWTNLNRHTVPELQDMNIFDFVCAATDPYDTAVTYVGTWGRGLLKFRSNTFEARYDNTNSSLEVWTMNQDLINISGLAFDSKGNLWVANTGANNLLSVMDRNGQWRSYNLGGANSGIDLSVLMIDHNDYKWILRRAGNDDKIIVFNDNGTLDNPADDQVVSLRCSEGHGGLSGSAVNCFAVDRNGYVWVGTDSGPCYFADTKKLFQSGSYDASVVLVPRNDGTDQVDALFTGIQVLSIAVDGNNNKWFGLESGVYEMSPDCKTQLLYFNTHNSPLFDNSVKTMTINNDGEVFFGTDQGVLSYRGTATPGGEINSEVTVYPNPVRPGFNGYVGIKGLVEDALVKIATVDGTFVTQLLAEGGQAVWDCTTIDGQKVQPGIYLVFVSTLQGTERYVAKILVVN